MEQLLDAADGLAAMGDEPPRPDLEIPEELQVNSGLFIERRPVVRTSHAEDQQQSSVSSGQFGYFAVQHLPRGTWVMVEKPIAMVMDWQDDTADLEEEEEDEENIDDEEEDAMDEEEEKEPHLNELLLLEVLERLKTSPELWSECLSTLFPRTTQDLASLPAWVCANDEVFMAVEEHLEQLRSIPMLQSHVSDIAKRLPLVIRYNILSVETCSELLSYPGPNGHANLAGVGLFHRSSFFNHSSQPNCSRWAIGDVMCIVTNQDIPMNTELCLSYIEHDVLCESAYRRNQMLSMDFIDLRPGESIEPSDAEEQGPDMPVVDSDVQNELMGMDSFERLAAIDELMQQANGEKLPEQELEEGDGMDGAGGKWFQADMQNLRIIKAITLDGLGQSKEALALWEEAVQFCQKRLPPADESLVVAHVQTALCAYHLKDHSKAKMHAQSALDAHNVLFGGGVTRFLRRFQNEFTLSLRLNAGSQAADVAALWPQAIG